MRFYRFLAVIFLSVFFILLLLFGQYDNMAATHGIYNYVPKTKPEISRMVENIQMEQRQIEIAFEDINTTMSEIQDGFR